MVTIHQIPNANGCITLNGDRIKLQHLFIETSVKDFKLRGFFRPSLFRNQTLFRFRYSWITNDKYLFRKLSLRNILRGKLSRIDPVSIAKWTNTISNVVNRKANNSVAFRCIVQIYFITKHFQQMKNWSLVTAFAFIDFYHIFLRCWSLR